MKYWPSTITAFWNVLCHSYSQISVLENIIGVHRCCVKWIYNVLFSHDYCNELPQTWWLKTKEIYCLIALEYGSLKWVSLAQNQGVGSAVLLPEVLGRIPFLPFPALGCCQHSLTCDHITLVSVSVVTFPPRLCLVLCLCEISLCLSLIKTHMLALSVHMDNPGKSVLVS